MHDIVTGTENWSEFHWITFTQCETWIVARRLWSVRGMKFYWITGITFDYGCAKRAHTIKWSTGTLFGFVTRFESIKQHWFVLWKLNSISLEFMAQFTYIFAFTMWSLYWFMCHTSFLLLFQLSLFVSFVIMMCSVASIAHFLYKFLSYDRWREKNSDQKFQKQ